jgi:hypothetical protein
MRATTEHKAILRFLHLREKAMANGAYVEVAKLSQELRTLDAKTSDGHYGLSVLLGAENENLHLTLTFLDQLGMVSFKPDNPGVELTEFGRALACGLELPGQLEENVHSIFNE